MENGIKKYSDKFVVFDENKPVVKADFGKDKNGNKLRYSLIIELIPQINNENNNKNIIVIMMNPSKADRNVSDPTINKVIRICAKAGFSTLKILNSIPYYETYSDKIKNLTPNKCIILEKNIEEIKEKTQDATHIVIATGLPSKKEAKESMEKEILKVHELLENKLPIYVFGVRKDGFSKHPLYLNEKDCIDILKKGPNARLKTVRLFDPDPI